MRRIALILVILCTPAYAGETVATWYGKEHAGKRTASAEVFNPNGLTALTDLSRSAPAYESAIQRSVAAFPFASMIEVHLRRAFRLTFLTVPLGRLACVRPRV
jgi:hypothetical protein